MQDITDQNFEAELVNASLQRPVLLDIWAPWCGPCKSLGPVLEKLEVDYAGRFALGKLNSDDQPEIAAQLSQMFGVRSIPFCVLFKGGQPVDGFVGALPEAEVRKFLDKHVPSADESAADESAVGESAADEGAADADLTEGGNPDAAIDKFQAALAVNPANDAARGDLLRALIEADRIDDARNVFTPVAANVMLDPRLAAFGHWLAAIDATRTGRPLDTLQALLTANKRDFDARFELAQRHFAARRFEPAMDELLEIVMRDKTWRDELARKTYVAILEVMAKPVAAAKADAAPKGTLEVAGRIAASPANPVVDAYRRKLSMALF